MWFIDMCEFAKTCELYRKDSICCNNEGGIHCGKAEEERVMKNKKNHIPDRVSLKAISKETLKLTTRRRKQIIWVLILSISSLQSYQQLHTGNQASEIMTELVYYISAYEKPKGVVRLVSVLLNGSDHFYIHFDKSIGNQRINQFKTMINKQSRAKNSRFFSEVKTKWGSFGMVDATLNA